MGILSNKQTIQKGSKQKVKHARNNDGRHLENIREKTQTNMTNVQWEDKDINTQGWYKGDTLRVMTKEGGEET